MKNDPESYILEKLPPELRNNLERNLCVCNDVPKIDIINAIANGATTVAEVQNRTYATDGIGCCRRQVEKLITHLCGPEPK